jgi:HPt (histidine-containing phosphotransfer) domain-containing protein
MDHKIDMSIFNSMSKVLRSAGQFDAVVSAFITNGDDRLNKIREAIEQNQKDEIISVAHALKGSCALFGARICADLCQKIETIGQSEPSSQRYRSLLESLSALTAELDEIKVFLRKQLDDSTKSCCP